MTMGKTFSGLVQVSLVSAEPEAALSVINRNGIALYEVHREKELTVSFHIRRRDYPALKKLCEKRGESLTILRKQGFFFFLQQMKTRKTLFFGVCILFLIALYLPTRVLFVRVEGNAAVPSNRILEAAEQSGIRFGASRREVRSERVKNALLDAVPQLQWAGINTFGCTAVISVRERSEAAVTQDNTVASIVASRDGYILSSVVYQGTGLVRPGQTVKAGQVMISGYTDCGICIQATHAKGEIIAQTLRQIDAVTPAKYQVRRAVTAQRRKYSLLIGKKRIFFWKGSGISDTGCGRIYQQYSLTLPGGFPLPVGIGVDIYRNYDLETEEADRAEASAALSGFARSYLLDHMIAGQIQREAFAVNHSADVYRLRGSCVCREMIGTVRQEQIGETNGETNGTDSQR